MPASCLHLYQGPEVFCSLLVPRCGLGWHILRTQEFVSCAKLLADLLQRPGSPLPLLMLSLLHWHRPLRTPFQNSAGDGPGSCGPTVPQHMDTRFVKSILLGGGEKAGGKSTFSPEPCQQQVVSSGALVGNELCPFPTHS